MGIKLCRTTIRVNSNYWDFKVVEYDSSLTTIEVSLLTNEKIN